MKKSLDGVRVIDLMTFISGAFATMVLGYLGAEIFKIELPRKGDNNQQIPPYYH